MPISDLHRQVATIVLRAAAPYGFALGGGNALIAHKIIDRYTADVDVFTDLESGVKAATAAVEAALRSAGFNVEAKDKTAGLGDVFYGIGEGLAEWTVTAPDGTRMPLQLAYFDRGHAPVIMDFGPVLDLEDVVGGKTCALASRANPRDFLDIAAAMEHYSIEQLISFARRLDPGLHDEDFADAGRRLDRLDDEVFARYGLGPQDVARLRERFVSWPRS
jgi:hypothetical protein